MEKVKIKIAEVQVPELLKRARYDTKSDAALMESLRLIRQQEPIKVLKELNGKYRLVDGSRRLRAMRNLGEEEIEAVVLSEEGTDDAIVSGVVNSQRDNLALYEKMVSIAPLESKGFTDKKISAILRLDKSTLSHAKKVRDLPSAIVQALRDDKITFGHARCLSSCPQKDDQMALFNGILMTKVDEEGRTKISVRELEARVRTQNEKGKQEDYKLPVDAIIQELLMIIFSENSFDVQYDSPGRTKRRAVLNFEVSQGMEPRFRQMVERFKQSNSGEKSEEMARANRK